MSPYALKKAQITQAVGELNGVIAKRYAGQEHATAGWERQQLEQLLTDAGKKSRPFDAVIVTDPSRWSRDNVASEIGLEKLRDAGVRFFVLTTEHDLNKDDARLFLSITSTINGYQARVSARKSLDNRIRLARRGVPASGSLPYGRTFDKKTEKWGIDPKAKALMEEVARRYLAGESINNLGQELGVRPNTLYDRLEKCSGTLIVEFTSKTLNVSESIEMTIPALLDAATINAVRKQARANQTYTHGHGKHKYLFSRMVFCEHCGSALTGQYDVAFSNRYYRHLKNSEGQKACPFRGSIRADDLENVVIQQLFETFGNPSAVQKAIEEAVPDLDKLNDLRKRHTRITESLQKMDAARQRIIRLVGEDEISEAEAKKQLGAYRERQTKAQAELEQLNEHLAHVPNTEAIRLVAEKVSTTFRQYSNAKLVAQVQHANRSLDDMTWDDKRALVQMVFSGTTPDGDRMGVYIHRTGDRTWRYVVKGHLIHAEGHSSGDGLFGFGAPAGQAELLTKHASVTKPGPWAPTPLQRYSHPCRSTRRGGG